MDEDKEPYMMEFPMNGRVYRWPMPKDLLQTMKETYGIFPEGALFKDIDLPTSELFILPQTWGIQVIYGGAVVREWLVGQCKLHCYFEDQSEQEITKEQEVMLHEFCLKLLKKEYPSEYGKA